MRRAAPAGERILIERGDRLPESGPGGGAVVAMAAAARPEGAAAADAPASGISLAAEPLTVTLPMAESSLGFTNVK